MKHDKEIKTLLAELTNLKMSENEVSSYRSSTTVDLHEKFKTKQVFYFFFEHRYILSV